MYNPKVLNTYKESFCQLKQLLDYLQKRYKSELNYIIKLDEDKKRRIELIYSLDLNKISLIFKLNPEIKGYFENKLEESQIILPEFDILAEADLFTETFTIYNSKYIDLLNKFALKEVNQSLMEINQSIKKIIDKKDSFWYRIFKFKSYNEKIKSYQNLISVLDKIKNTIYDETIIYEEKIKKEILISFKNLIELELGVKLVVNKK